MAGNNKLYIERKVYFLYQLMSNKHQPRCVLYTYAKPPVKQNKKYYIFNQEISFRSLKNTETVTNITSRLSPLNLLPGTEL